MKPEFLTLLQALHGSGVEFVLVGGVAAVVEGAIVYTQDVDVVVSPAPANLERLLATVRNLDFTYRDPVQRVIRPTLERLRDNRMNLLRSAVGDLDVMQQIAPGWGYDDVLARSQPR